MGTSVFIRMILIIVCIITFLTITSAFETTPIITHTGPRGDFNRYLELNLDDLIIDQEADIIDIEIGQPTSNELDSFEYVIVSFNNIANDLFREQITCFWLTTTSTTDSQEELTWAMRILVDAVNNENDAVPADSTYVGFYAFPTTTHDFTNEFLHLRCQVFINHQNIYNINPYADLTFNIQYRFQNVIPTTDYLDIAPTSFALLPPPRYRVISPFTYPDGIDGFTHISAVINEDYSSQINFRMYFLSDALPQAGDSFALRINSYDLDLSDIIMTTQCHFSTNYNNTKSMYKSIVDMINNSLYIEIYPYLLMSIPISSTTPVQEYIQCTVDISSFGLQVTQFPFDPQNRELMISEITVRGRDHSTTHNQSYISFTGTNSLKAHQVAPTLIYPSTTTQIITIDVHLQICEWWQHPFKYNCILQKPPVGVDIPIHVEFSSGPILSIGTIYSSLVQNWIGTHTITIAKDITFPTSGPKEYFIEYGGQHITLATRRNSNSNYWFMSYCATYNVSDNYIDTSCSDQTNYHECDTTWTGFCTCAAGKESQFNPSFELPNDSMCSPTPRICDETIIECQNDSIHTQSVITNQCQCSCQNSRWRDCRTDTTPTDYQPRITIEQGPITFEYSRLSSFAPNNDNTFEYENTLAYFATIRLIFDFGTMGDFYDANLHYVKYFKIDIGGLPPSITNLQDAIDIGSNGDYTYNNVQMVISETECSWVTKLPNMWINDNINPIDDRTIKSIKSVNNLYYETISGRDHIDARLWDERTDMTLAALNNPFHQTARPLLESELNLQVVLQCQFYPRYDEEANVEVDLTALTAYIHGYGKYFETYYNAQPTIPHFIPTSTITSGDIANIRIQAVPSDTDIIARIFFDFPINRVMANGEYIDLQFPSSTLYHADLYECRFIQSGTEDVMYSVYDTVMYLDFGLPHLANSSGGVIKCIYYIIGAKDVFSNGDDLITKLRDDRYTIHLDSFESEVSSPEINKGATIDINTPLETNWYSPIAKGERLWFRYDITQYPILSNQLIFNTTTRFKIIMNYPVDTGFEPVELGFGIYVNQRSVSVVVRTNKLRTYTNGSLLTYTMVFESTEGHGLQSIPLQTISHINSSVLPYCIGPIPSSFGHIDTTDLCPGSGTCDQVGNQEGTETCTCADSTTNCLCTEQGYTWNGYSCIPVCGLNEVWDDIELKCVPNCPDDKKWNVVANQCVDKCNTNQSWNGSHCIYPCASDEITSGNHIDGFVCTKRCPTDDKIWDGSQCINRCNVDDGYYWDTTEEICRLTCTVDKIWDISSNQCIDKCIVGQMWDVGTNQCINRCTIDKLWDIAQSQCIDKCNTGTTYNSTTDACDDNDTTTPCNLSCKNNSTPNNECTSCNCTENSFFGGIDCSRCELVCLNSGTQNLSCSNCTCPRRGYTGLKCECHEISFVLVLSSVPKVILDEFEKDPINAGSAETALSYIRTQLLTQPLTKQLIATNTNLFDGLKIQKIVLEELKLKIDGAIRDNCEQGLDTNNYNQLQIKWSEFLDGLKVVGIQFDDEPEPIPIENVSFVLPELQCDTLFDSDCDGELVFEPNHSYNQRISIMMIVAIIFAFVF